MEKFRDHKKRNILIITIGTLLIILVVARLYLPIWLTDYVNKVLNNIEGYQGSVEDVDVHLYRGAYTINELKILKKEGKVPVPFFESQIMDISIEWGALLKGEIVSSIDFTKPQLNFAVNQAGSFTQTGENVDWIKPIKELAPFDINLVTFKDGQITFRDFSVNPSVNIFIKNMQAEVRNLRNVEDKSTPLPSPLLIKGDSIGGGKMQLEGKMNILKQTPDMDLNLKLENASLPAINEYSRLYAIDFEKGRLDVYAEIVVKDNQLSGYVKPIMHDISIVNIKDSNPIKTAWETVVSVVIQLFKNQPKDQFATKAILEGNLDNIQTNRWSAIAGIFRNAFIQSFSRSTDDDVSFEKVKDKKD